MEPGCWWDDWFCVGEASPQVHALHWVWVMRSRDFRKWPCRKTEIREPHLLSPLLLTSSLWADCHLISPHHNGASFSWLSGCLPHPLPLRLLGRLDTPVVARLQSDPTSTTSSCGPLHCKREWGWIVYTGVSAAMRCDFWAVRLCFLRSLSLGGSSWSYPGWTSGVPRCYFKYIPSVKQVTKARTSSREQGCRLCLKAGTTHRKGRRWPRASWLQTVKSPDSGAQQCLTLLHAKYTRSLPRPVNSDPIPGTAQNPGSYPPS